MTINRVYDSTVEEIASVFPRFNVSDAEGTRAVLDELLEAAAASGIETAHR